MNKYEEGLQLIEEKFGGGQDINIALATIALESGENGNPKPVVREVDAYYEDGVFYVTSYAKSNKILQILQNQEVSIAATSDPKWFTANGKGENLGWIMKPENAELRTKLRKAFEPWYDMANNEADENCCILAVRLTKGTLNINHWEKLYHMDFVNKVCE
jgi:hypothetical protein